jgi:hypothetical protein
MGPRFALVALLASASWVSLAAAAQSDYVPNRIQRTGSVLPPGRVGPQHSFFFDAPAYWPQGLHWHYNSSGAPAALGLDDAEMLQKFVDAAAKWSDVCGVRIVYDGPSPVSPFSFDGVNVIGWGTPGGGLQAETSAWSNTMPNGDQVLVESDIMLDPAVVTTPQILASLLTHEWGHAIGLGHSPVDFALMSGPPDSAYSNLTDLTPDDVQGCRCLYGLPANVQEGYTCSLPSKIDFGTVAVGSSSERQVDVTNHGNAALTLGNIQAQGGDFAVRTGQCGIGTRLIPSASCRFSVVASPAGADLRRAEAIINTSGGPYRIPLSVQGAPAPLELFNFEGAWWNAPAGSEDGWGLTLAHQNDVIFATWYTYDGGRRPLWMSMTAVRVGSTNSFSGTLYRTIGPPLGSQPFDREHVQYFAMGDGALDFTDAHHGLFTYTLNRVAQSKLIERFVFAALPTCIFDSPNSLVASTNYQGNWWEASGLESGWGIYLAHQGDNIFTAWFTYDVDGSPLWLSATAAKTSDGVYHGDVLRTAGPPFKTEPFSSQQVTRSIIGALTLTFADGNHASMTYSLMLGTPPVSISRDEQLTRFVFRPPGTLCN